MHRSISSRILYILYRLLYRLLFRDWLIWWRELVTGDVLLWTSFIIFGAAFLGLLTKEIRTLQEMDLARRIRYSHIKLLLRIAFLSITSSAVLLFYYFLVSDLSIHYVWLYSSCDLPLIYRISAFWTGEGGSFLFLTCVIFAVSLRMSEKYGFGTSVHRKNQIIILFMGLLFLYLTIRHSPFTGIFEIFPDMTSVPADGRGMDPMLMNFWMVFHPPGIFLGYGLLVLTFSTVFVSLIEPFDWEPYQRAYSRLAWAALGAGIVSGCLWSYDVWEGYWTWDPAFTSSLMVWLILTAFLHSSVKYRREKIYPNQTRALGAYSFVLAIYSIYMIHSGTVQSVHVFGEGGKVRLLLEVAVAAGLFTLLLLYRYYQRREEDAEKMQPARVSRVNTLLSSKNMFTATILLLAALVFVICWGLTFPLLMQLTGIRTAISIAIYTDWGYPLTLLLLAVLGVCMFGIGSEKNRLRALLGAVGALVFFLIIPPFENLRTNISTPVLAFAALGSLYAVVRSARTGRIRITSTHIIHLGTALILTGALMSTYTVSETVLFRSLDDTKTVGGYDIRLNDLTISPPHINAPHPATIKTATYSIYRNGQLVGKGSASFEERRGEYITHVYTHRGILADVRITYQGIGTISPVFISVANIKVVPGMSILWTGCVFVVFGMLPVLLHRKKE